MTQDVSFKTVYGYYRNFWDMLRTYFDTYTSLTSEVRKAAIERLRIIIYSAQKDYSKMSAENDYCELGLNENLALFRLLIGNVGRLTKDNHQLADSKSELNRQLKQTKKEISELNQQLNLTSDNRIDCANEIKTLEKSVEDLKSEIEAIHSSATYHIGRFFTAPVRKLRELKQRD